MKKIKIFVTGYENAGGISGWDWFYNKEDADKQFSELEKAKPSVPNSIIYRGEREFELSENSIEKSEGERTNITSLVELFLEENEFENAFK